MFFNLRQHLRCAGKACFGDYMMQRTATSTIRSDLAQLQKQFPSAALGRVVTVYREKFKELTRDAKTKVFILLLAKRYAAEQLRRECPPEAESQHKHAPEGATGAFFNRLLPSK